MDSKQTLFASLKSLEKYANGDRSEVEIITYQLEGVPDYGGKDIKAIRKQLNLSQRALAEVLGVSVRTVENWEIDKAKANGSARRLLQLLQKEPKIIQLVEHTHEKNLY